MSEDKNRKIRIINSITTFLVIAMVLVQSINTYNIIYNSPTLDPSSWRFYIRIFIPVPLLIGAIVGLIKSRQGKLSATFYAIQAGGLLSLLLMPWVISYSEIYVLFIVLGVIVFSAFFLPQKQSAFAIYISVGVGILILLIDLWIPWDRSLGVNDSTQIERIISGVVLTIIIGFVFSQIKSFNLQTKLILLFILVPVLIVGGVSSFLGVTLRNQFQDQLKADSQNNVSELSAAMVEKLASVEANTRFLSRSETLSGYLDLLEDGSGEDALEDARSRLKQDFLNFAQAQRIYDQVRFIDATGQEVVRINTTNLGHSISVFDSSLSNKASRYYFDETFKLKAGEIYISALDLNIERGQIETPYQPVIRYATPVIHNGETKGIVIINVRAQAILQSLLAGQNKRYLVDTDGYYLYHPDDEKRWGRDLQTGFVFFDEFRAIAPDVFAQGKGTTQDEINFYTFESITLPSEQQARWYLIEAIGNEFVAAQTSETYNLIQAIASIAILLSPVLSLFISRTIAVPILNLTKSVEQIAAGQTDVEIEVRGHDEVAMLASTFKMMAQRVGEQVGGLQMRASELSRDLLLTAEIGVRIGQIRELEGVLNEAVRLIRNRYDLYYVQIYLTDADEKILTMQAGTGEVGQQLRRRHYQLPIQPTSISGRAAAEKRSIIVTNAETNPFFRPEPFLPDTRSEAAIPLIISDRVVGILDLQSSEPRTFSEANRQIFEVLASQLASTINSVRLFEEAEQARQSAAQKTTQVIQEAWDEFLDGVRHKKRIGYRYDGNSIRALDVKDIEEDRSSDEMPISIGGELIGALSVHLGEEKQLSGSDQAFLQTVTEQIAQRIDNLRLLSEAERFRQEAETAAKRIIHESWLAYRENETTNAYQYDRQQVRPIDQVNEFWVEGMVSAPVDIQGEVVGQLYLEGINEEDENAYYLIALVADQLGKHIENLRLSAQTEGALAETKKRSEELALINAVSELASSQLEMSGLFASVGELLQETFAAESLYFALYDSKAQKISFPYFQSREEGVHIVAARPLSHGGLTGKIIESRQSLLQVWEPEKASESARIAGANIIGEGRQTDSYLGSPMIVGNELIGVMALNSYREVRTYSEQDKKLLETLADTIGIAVQNIRQFQTAQRRAERETMINNISQKIQSATTVESALQTAVSELGQALKLKKAVVELATNHQGHGNGNSQSRE